ncbi:Uncharacterised protein [Mycobacteroides abscessus subsp. abscessus]|nr:Uncharacterised protein [Mycobacteroides abscessus subsp. abscessus]
MIPPTASTVPAAWVGRLSRAARGAATPDNWARGASSAIAIAALNPTPASHSRVPGRPWNPRKPVDPVVRHCR